MPVLHKIHAQNLTSTPFCLLPLLFDSSDGAHLCQWIGYLVIHQGIVYD